MLYLFRLVCLIIVLNAGSALSGAPYKKAILISIDGLRPDILRKTPTPNIDSLIQKGVLLTAKAVRPVKTLPNHASMISGVDPAVHGITWNDYQPQRGVIAVPTLFKLASLNRITTAFIYGKEKLSHLNDGHVNHALLPAWPLAGSLPSLFPSLLARKASVLMHRENPGFTFIHFPLTDLTGHTFAWGSVPRTYPTIVVENH